MARKLTAFEKQCTTINNRLSGYQKGDKERKIYGSVYQPGIITRMYRRRRVWYCSECGSQIGVLTQEECPVCHKKWTAACCDEKGREVGYHMTLEAKGDIQLTRIYRVERTTHYGKQATRFVWEVERIMYSPTGERKVFARNIQAMSWYYDAFSCGSPIKMKRECNHSQYSASKSQLRYNLNVWSYDIQSLTEQWKYKDIPALMEDFNGDTSALRVIAYPWAETMRKTGQEKLFRYLVNEMESLPAGCHHALNICARNKYTIKDPSLWLDHLWLLKYLRLDTHNAHYVCPKDLRTQHNELLERKRHEDERRAAIRRERETQRKLERMEKEKTAYRKRWAKVLPLTLSGQNLNIRPLQSVEEFAEEGNAMHHCVFGMEYYKKSTSLILSAKDSDGNRLATIEYNTKNKEIVQCRAACNKVPERDAEIRQLITSHRADFQRLLKAA